MTVVIILVVFVILVAVVAWWWQSQPNREGGPIADVLPTMPLGEDAFSLTPQASDFHVEEGEAHVYFDVPLPDDDPDPVLTNILLSAAVETLREKRAHLPLDGVNVVHAHGIRNGLPASAGSITLDGPGQLPDANTLGALEIQSEGDLFASLEGAPAQAAPPDSVAEDSLAPLTDELEITSGVEAGLRAQGIDPATASTASLVAGLLRLGGYTVPPDPGESWTATRQGRRTFVSVVEYDPGGHPSLGETEVNRFIAQFTQSGLDQGLLFTPRYGPFSIYEKERRERRVRFITRERFQMFVNSIAVG